MAAHRAPHRNRQSIRMLRFWRHFHRQSNRPSHHKNRVTFYSEGGPFFQALFSALQQAQQLILLEYYIIHNDTTGSTLARMLIEAVKRGVQVLLIYDYIGCLDTPSSYFSHLKHHGIAVLPFNPPSFRKGPGWFDKRDHRKMTIIDGRLAFLGGFNIGDEYAGLPSAPRRFRDMGISMQGSAVQELSQIFFEIWSLEKPVPPHLPPLVPPAPPRMEEGATILVVSGGPHQRASYIRSAYRAAIASASSEILIATPYFVPGPRIMRSLLRAAQRGVHISILLPAISDVPLVRLLGRSYYTTLLRAGIEIYELGQDVLHAKVMVIDEIRTVIGSANLDQRSFHRNYEINSIIDSPSFGAQVIGSFRDDLRRSHRISLEDHEQRGIIPRALEKIIALFAWFL